MNNMEKKTVTKSEAAEARDFLERLGGCYPKQGRDKVHNALAVMGGAEIVEDRWNCVYKVEKSLEEAMKTNLPPISMRHPNDFGEWKVLVRCYDSMVAGGSKNSVGIKMLSHRIAVNASRWMD